MKAHDYRNLSAEELKEKVRSLKAEAYSIRMDVLAGKEKNSAKAKQLRREVARATTVLKERKKEI